MAARKYSIKHMAIGKPCTKSYYRFISLKRRQDWENVLMINTSGIGVNRTLTCIFAGTSTRFLFRL